MIFVPHKEQKMNLPSSFADTTRALLGAAEYEAFAEALQTPAPVSVRFNYLKHPLSPAEAPADAVPQVPPLASRHTELAPVPWAVAGYYLEERPTFTFDPLFHAGCYYVQEASSMFIEQVVRQYIDAPVVALDLCAAPGGKSTHLRSLLPEGSLLVANEVIRTRSQVLAENLAKWGHPDVVVTNNDPADFAALPACFDLVLTDVPCSGEGMFRKDDVAVQEWSPEGVEHCRQRQRRILADVWQSLKPGGLLIYSTCTYNTRENEENICWLVEEMGAIPLPVATQESWLLTGSLLPTALLPVYRFLPHKTRGEGFFLAALRKPSGAGEAAEGSAAERSAKRREKERRSGAVLPKEALAAARSWLHAKQESSYELLAEGTTLTAFPRAHTELLSLLKRHLRLLTAGTQVAEVKGKDLIPAHTLALSLLLRAEAFTAAELTYEQAIAYLRKEALLLPPMLPRGYVLLTYRGIPLGFAKQLGNRANNLYPQEWRIRSGYLPQEIRLL